MIIIVFISILIILYELYSIHYQLWYRKVEIERMNSYLYKYDMYDLAQYIFLCAKQNNYKITDIGINNAMIILYKKYLIDYTFSIDVLFNDFELKKIDYNDNKIWCIPKLWSYLKEDLSYDKKSELKKGSLYGKKIYELDLKYDEYIYYGICQLLKYDVNNLNWSLYITVYSSPNFKASYFYS